MRMRNKASMIALGMLALVCAAYQAVSPAQQAKSAAERFEFQVVESFDAKYLGDRPGHLGRGGGLGQARPNVALGDPVFHDEQRVGAITGLRWDRTKESLEVEFESERSQRVTIGAEVWISLKGPAAAPSK